MDYPYCLIKVKRPSAESDPKESEPAPQKVSSWHGSIVQPQPQQTNNAQNTR